MTKYILLAMFSFLSIVFSSAQDVRYYKLTRKVENGKSSTNVSGGQFITFVSDMCFESNKNGVGVNHGTMTRNSAYSNSEYTTYQGSSYWGKNADFKFNADKSVLNVVLNNGDVYVYKRGTAPAGQTTCSLIRNSSSGGGGTNVGGFIPQPVYPNLPYNPTPTPQPTPSPSQPTPTPTPQPSQIKCSLCNGTGKVAKNTYPPQFGSNTDYKVRCPECGEEHLKSDGHVHVSCPNCHGRGYIK